MVWYTNQIAPATPPACTSQVGNILAKPPTMCSNVHFCNRSEQINYIMGKFKDQFKLLKHFYFFYLPFQFRGLKHFLSKCCWHYFLFLEMSNILSIQRFCSEPVAQLPNSLLFSSAMHFLTGSSTLNSHLFVLYKLIFFQITLRRREL